MRAASAPGPGAGRMASPHLVLDNVCVELGGARILQDVSLTVAEREFVCVIGTSGGGKTTLLRTIAGLLPVASGSVSLDGAPVDGPSPRAAVVFQHFGLFPWKTVRSNIAYGVRVQGRRVDQDLVRRLLETLRLTAVADYYPAQLSGGMKQRVGIARALAAEAIREKRARIIKAEAEFEASVKLSQASEQMAGNPAALELRRMQMVSEVGAENNSTTVLMIPSDFVSLAHSLNDYLQRQASQTKT